MASENIAKIVIDPKESSSPSICLSPSHRIHSSFSSEDADIVLRSQDGVSFRVYSIVLKQASGWFRSLFQLPQSSQTATNDPIDIPESSDLFFILLSMISGLEIPRLDDIDLIENLVHVAEKYDMPGALSIIRFAILQPTLLATHPIRVYAIACRWGWKKEAKIASSHTIMLDLLSVSVMQDLRKVDPSDLTRLMLLHRRRRDEFRNGLDSTDIFYANLIPGRCSGCSGDIIHDKWHRLKYEWIAAIEQTPIDVASKDLLERLELEEVLNSKCTRCQKKLYNTEGTISNLREIMENLPNEVEFDD
ncbi:hypothetical protein C8Q75DRAFT_561896 [Abortiporus biennis]|nr:hypothetical protein C8Q75DRAFT_561896 [Abortiporus biennis]